MARAYCLTCNEEVEVGDADLCPRGHRVVAEDLGPQPWIGRALSHVGMPMRNQREEATDMSQHEDPAAPEPDEPAEPQAEEPDELARLLADIDDGGPADLPLDDEADGDLFESAGLPDAPESATAPAEAEDGPDGAGQLAALAEELALHAEGSPDDDNDDDSLGPLDEAMTDWDRSDEAIVAPSAPVPTDELDEPEAAEASDVAPATADELVVEAASIPPPPPAGSAPPVASPPPPPPPPSADDRVEEAASEEADQYLPATDDMTAGAADMWPDETASTEASPPAEEPAEEPVEPPAPREIDLTNFTASGKRVDTSSVPRKRGIFPFGR